MKVIVIGNGKVGSTLVNQLNDEGHDIVVIDKKLDRLEALNNSTDVLCIHGDGINMDILTEAGISTADLVISTTSSDELNMISSMLAKTNGAKNVVARIRSKEYVTQENFIKKNLNIDYIINPELQTAKEIANQFRFVGDFKFETFSKGFLEILSFKIQENFKIVGLTLSEINSKYEIKMLVGAVERESDVFIPDGNFIIQKNDIIYVIATYNDINKMLKILEIKDKRADSVFIVGASKLTYYLAKELNKMNVAIKIVDNNKEVCEQIAEQLPYATIIHADASNQSILEEEGAFNADAFISLTGNDEMNIILSLYTKTKKIKKVIAKVNQTGYMDLVKELGLNNTFSPKDIITNKILSYFRSLERREGSAKSIHKLIKGKVEAIEFLVNKEFKYKNISLKELSTKKGILIAGIIRNSKILPADGNTVFKEDDIVLVLALDIKLRKLEDIIYE